MFAQLEYSYDGPCELVLYRDEAHCKAWHEDSNKCAETELITITLTNEQLTHLLLRCEVKPEWFV